MAETTDSDRRAEQLRRAMGGLITSWGPRPLDTGSHTPAQNDPPQRREEQ